MFFEGKRGSSKEARTSRSFFSIQMPTYLSDGTGRDLYIGYNNGGKCICANFTRVPMLLYVLQGVFSFCNLYLGLSFKTQTQYTGKSGKKAGSEWSTSSQASIGTGHNYWNLLTQQHSKANTKEQNRRSKKYTTAAYAAPRSVKLMKATKKSTTRALWHTIHAPIHFSSCDCS